jgi:hypothetical protein
LLGLLYNYMNGYERIYNILLEEALIAEQRKMTSRQKLGVTAAMLGSLAAGVAKVGDSGVPKAVSAPKATVTTQRQQADLPNVPKPKTRTQAPEAPTTQRVQKLKDRFKDLKQKGMGFDKDPKAYMKALLGQKRN